MSPVGAAKTGWLKILNAAIGALAVPYIHHLDAVASASEVSVILKKASREITSAEELFEVSDAAPATLQTWPIVPVCSPQKTYRGV
jgi:hypothetical protein